MKTIRGAKGFTLIELVITVTIIIILGAIAIPNYRNYVVRANRSDAMTALLQIASAQEKFYLQNNTYTTDLDALNAGALSPNEHYVIAVLDGADSDGFIATATPDPDGPGSQADDTKCTEFRIDQDGTKTASGSAPDTCWR